MHFIDKLTSQYIEMLLNIPHRSKKKKSDKLVIFAR